MRWSKLKQTVESRFATDIQARVAVHLTSYRHAHDGLGRGYITLDGREVASYCYWTAVRNGGIGFDETWVEGVRIPNQAEFPLAERGPMGPQDFARVLVEYLSLPLEKALRYPNHLIRALAMLDARLGRRRLRALSLSEQEHKLVRLFHSLRLSAEHPTRRGSLFEKPPA